jgi:hypothetical protein
MPNLDRIIAWRWATYANDVEVLTHDGWRTYASGWIVGYVVRGLEAHGVPQV